MSALAWCRRSSMLLASFAVALLCACGEEAAGVDDASVDDAADESDAPESDAPESDAPVVDATPPTDAPTVDAGTADAATTPDAATVPDAATTLDAATVPDAATTPDAAALPDASTSPDAAMPGPDASIPPGLVCDPVHQVGCGPGEKCDLAENGNFACVPDGTLGDFRRCNPEKPNACAAGFTCRGTFFGDHRCARLCLPGEDQCRVDEPCNSIRTTTDGHQYRMCATNQQCNPILDDCSDPTKHCTWNLRGVCVTPGHMPDGSSCQSSLNCQQGSACLKAGLGNVYKCFRLCDPAGGAPGCASGVACTLFTTVGPQDVGACGYAP